MSTLRVLIVDDELPARERLRALLAETGEAQVVGEATDGEDALRQLDDCDPDIVLLDVRMPGMDGIETARRIAENPAPPAVIFTTAFDEYALSAFDAQAVAYLLKPIRREKLAAALAQAGRLTRPQLAQAAAVARFAPQRTHIAVKVRDTTRLIPLAEVRCFIADQKYVTVRHEAGEDLIEESLKSLEEDLGTSFVRIHRSALVNIAYLAAIERNAAGQYCVRLRERDERLVVSRRMASELRERFRI
ncbi:MAG: LytTR family DNA-binding domain-containing protein [Steroidobacteraceae bacterium]